jgi:hypothetical protein
LRQNPLLSPDSHLLRAGSECDEGFTLCGHTEEDQGQCVEGVSSYEFSFVCGTGGEGSDFPSTDGYNYCGMANHCPCSRAGCYMDCTIDEVCWGYNVARGGRGGNWPDLGWTYLEMGYEYVRARVNGRALELTLSRAATSPRSC